MRKRSKTPTKIQRKKKYILKKYYDLLNIISDRNLNLYVNISDNDIIEEKNIEKLDSIKNQILFLIRLTKLT